MRPPIALKEHHTAEQLQKFCKDSKDEAQKTRLRAIINIKKGKSRSEVIELFDINRDTVTNWVNTYNEKGAEGLKTNLGGRKEGNPKWDKDIFEKLGKEIDAKKGQMSYSNNYLFSAVAPLTGKSHHLLGFPDMDGDTVNVFLLDLKKQHPDKHVFVVWDNAPTHRPVMHRQ